MIQILRLLLRQVGASLKSHAVLQLENLVLRHQIEILKRSAPRRVRLTRADRVLFTWLFHLLNPSCFVIQSDVRFGSKADIQRRVK